MNPGNNTEKFFTVPATTPPEAAIPSGVNVNENQSTVQHNIVDLQSSLAIAQNTAYEVLSHSENNREAKRLINDAVTSINLAHQKILNEKRQRMKKIEEEKAAERSKQMSTCQIVGQTSTTNTVYRMPKIQRSYKLTHQSSYEVWLDSLKTELTSYQLLDLIDSTIPEPTGVTEVETALRKNPVKDIIISHIDEEYHKKILGMTEPKTILCKLRDSRKGEVMSTPNFNKDKIVQRENEERRKSPSLL